MATRQRGNSTKPREADNQVLKWEDLDFEEIVETDEVPEGWITSDQYAQMAGLAKATASQRLIEMERRGIAERKKFRIRKGEGQRVYPIWHYKRLK